MRYANALTGLAAGDAWGYQVEFTSYAQMPAYPVAPPDSRWWLISDDTQMTLALHWALADVPTSPTSKPLPTPSFGISCCGRSTPTTPAPQAAPA
ncbi:ADP-ribosylglycohydrolase family protein [Pontibacter rugosus]